MSLLGNNLVEMNEKTQNDMMYIKNINQKESAVELTSQVSLLANSQGFQPMLIANFNTNA